MSLPALALAGLLVVLDLAPLNVQSRFRPDLEPLRTDMAALREELGAARAVVASRRNGKVDLGQWAGWDGTGLATGVGDALWGPERISRAPARLSRA